MLLFLIEWIALVFYWTWFIWPPVFIISLVNAIAHAVRTEVANQMGQEPPEPNKSSVTWAVISLVLILSGIMWPLFA